MTWQAGPATNICPCCHQVLPDRAAIRVDRRFSAVVRFGRSVQLGPLEFDVFVVLNRWSPNPVPAEGIMEAIYGDDDEARPGASIMFTIAYRLRKNLEPLGLTVETVNGGYRVVDLIGGNDD